MRKTVAVFAAFMTVIMLPGCFSSAPRTNCEDIRIFELYADEIGTLRNPLLPINSVEKYRAAVELNKKVDFSYARNVRTLDEIFNPRDAIIEYETIKFRYMYRENTIEFKFIRHGNVIISSEVIHL